MPLSLEEEISFMWRILICNNVRLSTLLGHIVLRGFNRVQAADSCKRSGGGWSVDLLFWWDLVHSKEVIDRAYLPHNKSGLVIASNVLEVVCVIVDMAAAIFL